MKTSIIVQLIKVTSCYHLTMLLGNQLISKFSLNEKCWDLFSDILKFKYYSYLFTCIKTLILI